MESSEPLEFLGHRLQTSMTRATVDSTASLGETLRTGRPLVGGSSFHGVSALCMSSLPHRLPGGIQAQGLRPAADAGLGLLFWWLGNFL